MNTTTSKDIKKIKRLITLASIAIPLVVVILFGVKIEGYDLTVLPTIYAGINALTAILLVAALIFIKQKKIHLHETTIKICLVLSLLFLVLYIAYHMTSTSTEYLGAYKAIYYPILISHIVLSVAVVPLVLYTYMFAWTGDFVSHKKWTKFTWPIWFYVAITGVIVYLMISPYYGN